jgi:hypothetical protein
VRGALRGLWHAHVGWLWTTQGEADARKYASELVEDRFMRWLHRHYHAVVLATFALPLLLGFAVTGTWQGALTGSLWGGFVRVAWIHHVTWSINSVCHFFGRRRFALERSARIGLGGHPGGRLQLALPLRLTIGADLDDCRAAHPTTTNASATRFELPFVLVAVSFTW